MKWALPCLSLLCVVALGQADDKWAKVEPKDGNCEIQFPGKATEKVDDKNKSTQVTLELMDGKAVYMLQFNDMPNKIPIDQADVVKKIFDGGQSGLTNALKGKITKSDDSKFGKYPARDIDMEVPMLGLYRVKLVLTGDKLYQVTAAGPTDFVKGDDVKKFMESFKIND